METIDFLPLVKAYPALSKTYGEVSCVAGVEMASEGPRWIRLYPVPFRALDDTQQFKKYQPTRVEVETHRRDRRPETRRPNRDSIRTVSRQISPADGWRRRRRFVEPLMVRSMCEIQRRQAVDGTSLGVFRPRRILGMEIEPADIRAERIAIAKAWAAQGSLLDRLDEIEQGHQLAALEAIPWTFRLRYECDDPRCGTHLQSIIDWEIAEFYRRVRRGRRWRESIRRRWLADVCGADRDTALFVGNMHQRPRNFLILGFWWPPRQPDQMTFSDLDYAP